MLNISRRDFLTFSVSLFALSQFEEMCHLQIDEMIPWCKSVYIININ